jgi:hypothetical protein
MAPTKAAHPISNHINCEIATRLTNTTTNILANPMQAEASVPFGIPRGQQMPNDAPQAQAIFWSIEFCPIRGVPEFRSNNRRSSSGIPRIQWNRSDASVMTTTRLPQSLRLWSRSLLPCESCRSAIPAHSLETVGRSPLQALRPYGSS